jgi:hypothetical protein
MPTNPSDDPPLINDVQFLEELDRLEDRGESPIEQGAHSRATSGDAFEALESGLPLKKGAPEPSALRDHPAPATEPYQLPAAQRRPAETRVPFVTAALVLVACLTAGAATAALVFHDRLAEITESPTATP